MKQAHGVHIQWIGLPHWSTVNEKELNEQPHSVFQRGHTLSFSHTVVIVTFYFCYHTGSSSLFNTDVIIITYYL